jgi:hypothetical protein
MLFFILFLVLAMGAYLTYFGYRTLPTGHLAVSITMILIGSAFIVFSMTQMLAALMFPVVYARWM